MRCSCYGKRGLLLALLFLFTLSACAKPYSAKLVDPAIRYKLLTDTILTSNKPSLETDQTLRELFLDDDYIRDPEETILTWTQERKKLS